MKKFTSTTIVFAATFFLALHFCQAADQANYEYRVMSLLDMFEGQPAAGKIADIVVQTKDAPHRTDMDAADYQEALNRLAAQGWELVTVNKSNYWVFRRPATHAEKQTP